MRFRFLPTLFLCVFGASAAANPDAAFTVQREYGVITVMGTVSSAAHEAILRDSAVRFFPDSDVRFELTRPITAPPGWALITDMALRAAATLRRGRIEIVPAKLLATGITANEADWQTSLRQVERTLLTGMIVEQNVVAVQPGLAHQDLCARQLGYLADRSTIEFERMSAELRSGAGAVLDAVLELSFDCPDLAFTVVGHAEPNRETGDAELAIRRARAVAGYLQAAGLAENRLAVAAGDSADAVSASGPRHNRRAEILARR